MLLVFGIILLIISAILIFIEHGSLSINAPYYFWRFATKKEKEKLFKVIKDFY